VKTLWEAIKKRSHELIYKTYTKIEAMRLRVTTFAIAKLEERYLNGAQKRILPFLQGNKNYFAFSW
jgi:hypothetical protein